MQVITRKYDPKYRKYRYDIEDEPKKQPMRIFLGEDIALVVIMNWRTVEERNLKMWLGLNLHDVSNTKEHKAVAQIMKALEGEKKANSKQCLRILN